MRPTRFYVICPAGAIRHCTEDLVLEAMPLLEKMGDGAEVVREDGVRIAMRWSKPGYPPPRTKPIPRDVRWWA